jgi:hypothetical protein
MIATTIRSSIKEKPLWCRAVELGVYMLDSPICANQSDRAGGQHVHVLSNVYARRGNIWERGHPARREREERE